MQHRNPQESHLPEIIRLLSTYHALTLLQLEAFYPELTHQKLLLLLKKLEKGGYIKRLVDEKDNRCNQLCITEKGRQVIEDSHQIFHEVELAMFAGFSKEEYETLERMLDRIYENLKKYHE